MREILISSHDTEDLNKDPIFQSDIHRQSRNVTRLPALLNSSDKCLSIELCPDRKLEDNLLPELDLNFCSVTWHSPTASPFKTLQEISAIQLAKRLSCQGYEVLIHVAGRNLKRDQAKRILNEVKGAGVRNIFALQGDSSQIIEQDDNKCDFPYAVDFVRFIRQHFGDYFCIGVAGYPDNHPQSRNLEEDIYYLKRKVLSGADFIITQASYDYDSFINFSKICRKFDIKVPIIPGIFIISSYKTLLGMSKFCGVPISSKVLHVVNKNKNNPEAVKQFGVFHATEIMKKILSDNIFKGVHIFSLNNLELVNSVLSNLGLYKNRIEYPL